MSEEQLFRKNLKNIIVQLMSQNYGFYFLKSRLVKAEDKAAEILVTGSSYAVHGIQDGECPGLVNLSCTSQDLYCDYELTRLAVCEREKRCLPMFKRNYILLGYYALYDDLSMNMTTRELMTKTYEPLIGKSHHYDGKRQDRKAVLNENYEYLSDEEFAICDEWITEFLRGKNYFNELYHREDNTEEAYRGIVWSRLNIEEKRFYGSKRALQHNKLYKHVNTAAENRAILEEYIRFLTDNEIEPVIVIPPFSKEYLGELKTEFKKELYQVLDELECPIEVYDFNEEELFCADDFFDMDHLNDSGAVKLTSMLFA